LFAYALSYGYDWRNVTARAAADAQNPHGRLPSLL
jgi:hypothetical protein